MLCVVINMPFILGYINVNIFSFLPLAPLLTEKHTVVSSNSYRLKIGVKQKTVVDNCETTQIFLSTLEIKWHLRPCPKEMLDYPAIHAPYYFSMVKGHEEE